MSHCHWAHHNARPWPVLRLRQLHRCFVPGRCIVVGKRICGFRGAAVTILRCVLAGLNADGARAIEAVASITILRCVLAGLSADGARAIEAVASITILRCVLTASRHAILVGTL
jgi:hypothetical protein